ncbi:MULTISPECIES: GNAT family N-acetyltransferase [Streptomyces]|uniref:GNAT family N-acetyltransferase n=2 Tax=Streptomyces TaxID=1883 RepID=A0A2U9P338_STRAS|nr:GNAT family N-acetyltransferase [Streptomyces actuosus]AWT43585.1 GNAT family N-acetyltransferase [Streptomyces actuosus]MBM4824222.1 GNAT family N-acetyltransferase [Streptomyces actuosus]
MNTGNTVSTARLAEDRWEALSGDRVVGHGDLARRADGRLFLSIDVWQDEAFDQLAAAMLADLDRPLHTLVGEDDHTLTARWERLGFAVGRREWEYLLPTDPRETGTSRLPAGVTILPAGEADEGPLRALDRAIRDEVEATVGWHTMPAEVVPRAAMVVEPSKYAVAVLDGAYVGLVRVARVPRRARIGLLAVRADLQRRGIGRALLTHALGALHRDGIGSARAEIDASNAAAIALAEGVGGRRTGSCLELVRH